MQRGIQHHRVIDPRWLFLLTAGLLVLAPGLGATPLYVDRYLLPSGDAPVPDETVQQRADRIARLTDYIAHTYRVGEDRAVAIVTEAVYFADKYQLAPELVLAIIAVESSYRAEAVSHAGARGLMQIMPWAHPEKVQAVGGIRALFHPKRNIATGCRILLEYLNRSDGNLNEALLRYNGSLSDPTERYAHKVLRYLRKLRDIASLS